MKHLLNNLSDEEKNNIRNQHTGGMKVMTESFSRLLNSKLGDSKPLVNEQPIHFRVAFKPVATIMQTQASINTQGDKIELEGKGRHDACVVPRAVPIVEAMAALVILDFYLRNKSVHL